MAQKQRRPVIDAVIRTGGKQYRVHAGSVLDVATLDAEPGSRLELNEVLLVSDGDTVKVGSPTVDGAVVVAEVVEHGKGKKVINFKYKAKVRYRRKRGHRQGYTRLSVQEITLDGKTEKAPARRIAVADAPAVPERPAGFAGREEEEAPAPARRRTRAAAAPAPEATETAEPAAEASIEAAPEAAESKPAPRRRRAAASSEAAPESESSAESETAAESESKE
jgi:large subunit ribosomal protein L21